MIHDSVAFKHIDQEQELWQQIPLLKSLLFCLLPVYSWGFPCGSSDKKYAYNAGDLGWEDPLEKGKAAHPSILAWRTPWIVYSSKDVE